MITQKRRFGDIGEEKACQYLISNGYRVIGRNYHTKFGEIDVIAKKGNRLIFFEVKTGHFGDWIRPEEHITAQKLKRLVKAVQMYFAGYRISSNQRWQLDSITVLVDKENKEIEVKHIENINIF